MVRRQHYQLWTRKDQGVDETNPFICGFTPGSQDEVFQGLGTLAGEYQIPTYAQPHTLHRKTCPPSSPTQICRRARENGAGGSNLQSVGAHSMVCRDGGRPEKVRKGLDLKPLNKSVLREVHPLPKVDETLAQLAGAKVFSKLVDLADLSMDITWFQECASMHGIIYNILRKSHCIQYRHSNHCSPWKRQWCSISDSGPPGIRGSRHGSCVHHSQRQDVLRPR